MKSKAEILKQFVEKQVDKFVDGQPAIDTMMLIADFVTALNQAKNEIEIKKVIEWGNEQNE